MLGMQRYPDDRLNKSKKNLYHCIVHLNMNVLPSPTDALIYLSQKTLKFTLKFTLKCSYMFRSVTTIRELVLEPS